MRPVVLLSLTTTPYSLQYVSVYLQRIWIKTAQWNKSDLLFNFDTTSELSARPWTSHSCNFGIKEKYDSAIIKYHHNNVCQTYSPICLCSICNYDISSATLSHSGWILSTDIILLHVDVSISQTCCSCFITFSREWFIHLHSASWLSVCCFIIWLLHL